MQKYGPSLKPSKSKSPGLIGNNRKADLISFLPIKALTPRFLIMLIALSKDEYLTDVNFSST